MITFESVGDYPNGYSLSEAEFNALHQIMDHEEEDYYDYAVTECRETGGLNFLVVEKRCPKYEYAHTYYRVDTDGSWGILFEPPKERIWSHEKVPEELERGVNWWLRCEPSHSEDVVMVAEDGQDALILSGFNSPDKVVWVNYQGTVQTMTGRWYTVHQEEEE